MQDGGVAGEVLMSGVRAPLIGSPVGLDSAARARVDRALVTLRERTGAIDVVRPPNIGCGSAGGSGSVVLGVDERAAHALETLRTRLDLPGVEADLDDLPMWDDPLAAGGHGEPPIGPEPAPERGPEPNPEPGPAVVSPSNQGRVVLDVDPQEFAEVLGSALARALGEIQFAAPPQQAALPPVIYRAPEAPRRSFWADTWHADVLLSVVAMVIVAVVLVAFAT